MQTIAGLVELGSFQSVKKYFLKLFLLSVFQSVLVSLFLHKKNKLWNVCVPVKKNKNILSRVKRYLTYEYLKLSL